jgi:phosphoserine phosphatase RsbU/P
VSSDEELLRDTAEELFEDAPCGYLSTDLDGRILKVNRTFEAWTGLGRAQLLKGGRFQDLLSPGGRIYHETHFAPLLQMQGSVREIAVEIVRADGSRLPALVNSVLRRDGTGRPQLIRTTVFDATDRRRYEQELLNGHRREHEIAHQLQRSMLSGALPATPTLEVEVSYRPSVSGLEVGGDWYDAFWLDDEDTLALVVGDVVGRGIEAAAAMGQLRSAVRALASTGLRPGRLLEVLDRYARRHRVGQMATLVYAELSVGSGYLRYACAGHPPPLIVPPGDESPCFAWEGRSTPLDPYMPVGERGEGDAHLRAGATVLLYTDGLIERRSHSVDEGMDGLRAEAAAQRGDSLAKLTGTIVRALTDEEHRDDICLLAARLGEAAHSASGS